MIAIYISICLILLGVVVRFFHFPYLSYVIVDFYQSMHLVEETKEDDFDFEKINHYIGVSLIVMGVVLIVGSLLETTLIPNAGTISSIFAGILLVDLFAAPKRYDKAQPKGIKALLFHWALMLVLGIMFYFAYGM